MENCSTGSGLGCNQKAEESCPRLLLGSCILRALGESLGAEVVVLSLFIGLSALLGDLLSPGGI